MGGTVMKTKSGMKGTNMPKNTPDYDNVFKTMKCKHKPKTTSITFSFPDGQTVDYNADNIILETFTKEYIVKKRLFPYIPFYIARYEKDIVSGCNIDHAVSDLVFFRDEMIRLHQENELTDSELIDLMGFVNTIITHITNGNQHEERLVNIMGGTVIETESEKLIQLGISQGISQGRAQIIVEIGREDGLDNDAILKRLQEKAGLSFENALAFLKQYGQ